MRKSYCENFSTINPPSKALRNLGYTWRKIWLGNLPTKLNPVITSPFIPATIEARTSFKRKVKFGELYNSLLHAHRAIVPFWRNRRTGPVDERFLERLQLAVTAVNECAVCSYVHSKMALEMGLDETEIEQYLTGNSKEPRPGEAHGLVFAEHYADTRGRPSRMAYNAFVNAYGDAKAKIILSAIQLMLAGNMVGLPMSAWRARRRGKPYTDSSRTYEWGMLAAFALAVPVTFVHAWALAWRPNVQWG
jgi:AhpD family alkylhydroperoxidase